MNTRITLAVLVPVLFALVTLSCREEPVEKPNLLSDIEAVPHPGGAVIHFTLAETEDPLEVEGEYTRANGELVNVKANPNQSTVTVEGVGSTGEHTVRLIVLDPDNPDTPLEETEISFTPLAPTLGNTFSTLEASATYGGIRLKAINETGEKLKYYVLTENSEGKWSKRASFTSIQKHLNKTVRGFTAETRTFGFTISDQWNNYSDTLFAEVTPILEEELSNTDSQLILLPNDATRNSKIIVWSKSLFDGRYGENMGWPNGVYLTDASYTPGEPHMITIDLGVTAHISRVHIWDYPEFSPNGQNIYFARGAMRRFEIWGSLSDGLPSGELDNTWVKVGEYQSIKPSGLPEWVVNVEDIEAGNAGVSRWIDENAPPFRYIRIRCLENWGGGTWLALAELKFYGNTQID